MNDSKITIYWAGALFNHKELIGNSLLAKAVEKASHGRCSVRLPQDIEEEAIQNAVDIRNADLAELIQCDALIANFDGADLDSGTVVEFCIAKALDMPTVLLRTDFRNGGESNDLPWNLMCAGWPRTEILLANALADYQRYTIRHGDDFQSAIDNWHNNLACRIIQSLDNVCAMPPWMSADVAVDHFRRTVQSIGGGLSLILPDETLAALVERKRQKHLLA